MDFQKILYTKDKGIAKITINRPEVRNALNKAARREIRQVIDDIKQDKSVRVLIITGAGDKAFMAGMDITELESMTPMDIEEFVSTLGQALYQDMENMDIPVIAMINGYCLAGGCELVMSCDIRIASDRAKFGQPEINIGFIPGAGATQRMPRLIGWGRAKELMYTGRIIDAEEALRIGLVDKVVPHDKLEEEVYKLAETIISKSQIIIKYMKQAITRGMYTDLDMGLKYEKAQWGLCFATDDHNEGINAFINKRQPNFKGR
ncbi:enoyl-CoA hydratase-related protein [Chloroflexota bacterium]